MNCGKVLYCYKRKYYWSIYILLGHPKFCLCIIPSMHDLVGIHDQPRSEFVSSYPTNHVGLWNMDLKTQINARHFWNNGRSKWSIWIERKWDLSSLYRWIIGRVKNNERSIPATPFHLWPHPWLHRPLWGHSWIITRPLSWNYYQNCLA